MLDQSYGKTPRIMRALITVSHYGDQSKTLSVYTTRLCKHQLFVQTAMVRGCTLP